MQYSRIMLRNHYSLIEIEERASFCTSTRQIWRNAIQPVPTVVGQLVWFEFIALKFYRPKRALGLGDQMAW